MQYTNCTFLENCIVAAWYISLLSPKFWHFPNIRHQTRCFEIPITFKHHLLIGKNKLMVIAIHKLHIFRKLYNSSIVLFIDTFPYDTRLSPKFWHFPKIWHQTRCFEIPTTFKHHLLIGKNKLVIAIHKLHIFRKCITAQLLFIVSTKFWHFPKNMTPD